MCHSRFSHSHRHRAATDPASAHQAPAQGGSAYGVSADGAPAYGGSAYGVSAYRASPHPVSAAPRESVPEPLHLRASDAERERVADVLRVHAGDGRLTPDELEQRLERAYAAGTRADLRALLSDLPATAPGDRSPGAAAPARTRGPSGGAAEWAVFLLVAVMLLTVWAATGAGAFWPAWPLGFWGFALLSKSAQGRRQRTRGGFI